MKKPAKAPRRISRQYLENAALYYLQRYATSAGNLRQVLLRKIKRSCAFHKVDPAPFLPLIEEMIGRYLSSGLLNDQGYAEARVSSLRRQGRSRQAIVARLQAKHLSADDIESALGKADGEEAELTAAIALAKRKKIGAFRTKPLADPQDRQKELAILGRAGFSYETARQALNYKNKD